MNLKLYKVKFEGCALWQKELVSLGHRLAGRTEAKYTGINL